MIDLPATTNKKLAGYAKAIKLASAKHVASAFDIAENLDRAHEELAAHGNGTFGAWVETECGFTRRTAENYRKLLTLGDGVRESLSQSCTLEALYLLARDTTPEEVIEAAVEKAESGERLTAKVVKAIQAKVEPVVVEDKPEAEPEPEPDIEPRPVVTVTDDPLPRTVASYTTDDAISQTFQDLANMLIERAAGNESDEFNEVADALDTATVAWQKWRGK